MSNKNKVQRTETQKETDQDYIAFYSNRLGSIGNLLVTISGLSYGFGFIIVNVYLATNYGIYSFEIFNAHYAYSGATFLLLCILAYFGASFLYNKMVDIRNKPVLQRVVDFIGWFAFIHSIYLAGILGITVIAQVGEVNSFADVFSNFPITLWLTPAILAFYAQIYFLNNRNWEKFPHNVPFPSSILTNVIFLAVFYGVYFYAFLPPSLGGGMPTPVTLVIDKNKVDVAQELLPVTSQDQSVMVRLIEQTSDSLYVLVDNQNHANLLLYPIRIDKSLIVGAIYPKKIKPSNRLNLQVISSTSTPGPAPIPTGTSTP